jgi:hypothetical protein
MAENQLEVKQLTLPSGAITQFSQQVARDIQVAIAEGMLTLSQKPTVKLDKVAQVAVDFMLARPLYTGKPRLIGKRAKLLSRELVEHALRYRLVRKNLSASLLKSRTKAQLSLDYAWAKASMSKEYIHSVYARFSIPHPGAIPQVTPAPDHKSVSFRVWRVECVDETGLEGLGGETGHDEIRMAATTVNAKGVIEKVSDFKVKDFKRDGDYKFYESTKVIKKFPIDPAWIFPQTNLVFLHLAETDLGGFGDFLHEFYQAVQGYVVSILVDVGISVGASIGGSLGSVGGPVGMVVGAIVGAVLGLVIGWLIAALKDDFFEPQASAIQIPSTKVNFSGSDKSPVYSLTYKGYDGKYLVYYDWLLATS